MQDHTDYIEFDRPDSKRVRVAFEIFKGEVLYYHCEFRHNDHSEWQSMVKNDDGYFHYIFTDDAGKNTEEKALYPTPKEISTAQDEINKRYNILSI